jgi:thermitase
MLLGISLTSVAKAAEYLVKIRNPYAISSFSNTTDEYEIQEYHAPGQLMKVYIPENKKAKAVVNILSNPQVEYMVPNFQIRAFTAPVDTQALREQYALARVRAEKAWAKAGNRGSKKVVVAVIDTGTDYRHKDLAPNVIPGYDFAGKDSDPMDETSAQNPGHGTHCSGIIGAAGVVDGGVVGLSPEVSIMPLRFLDKNGGGDLNNGIKAIDYAIEKKVDVISASWGASVPRSTAAPLIEAVKRAEAAGIVFVVAAANDGKNNDRTDVFPANANLSNTISVAASNANDTKPSWSNFGRAMVHVAAPGDAIISTLPNNRYGNLSGTSMATPLVSGLVALIKAQNPQLSPGEIRSLIQATGAKVSIQTACDCRVDAFEAVSTVIDKKMFVHPNAGTIGKGETLNFTGVFGQPPFKFTSSNTTVGSIDSQGVLTAKAEGETTVTVTDSRGVSATSYKIYVGRAPASNPGNPGNPGRPEEPGQPGECPLGDPAICQIACQFLPNLPWCQ